MYKIYTEQLQQSLTITSVIPNDDTTPHYIEGAECFRISFTPMKGTYQIKLSTQLLVQSSVHNSSITAAMFMNNEHHAMVYTRSKLKDFPSNISHLLTLTHEFTLFTLNSINERIFTLRVGTSLPATTVYVINGTFSVSELEIKPGKLVS